MLHGFAEQQRIANARELPDEDIVSAVSLPANASDNPLFDRTVPRDNPFIASFAHFHAHVTQNVIHRVPSDVLK